MADLTQTLLATLDPPHRINAEQQLSYFEQQNLQDYLTSLCNELNNPEKPNDSRHLAGILIKNAIAGKSEETSEVLAQRWRHLHFNFRDSIKAGIFSGFQSNIKETRNIAALILAKIAAIEVSHDLWPDFLDILIMKIDTATSPEFRQAAFESLRYICEECPRELESKAFMVLNTIQRGLRREETDASIKLSSITAMLNSIQFVGGNLMIQEQRDLIFELIFVCVTFEDVRVRDIALQCLSEIARNHYELLSAYILQIFNLTGASIQRYLNNQENEDVCKQAIEFWSTINEAESIMKSNNSQTFNYAAQALQHLCPLLQQLLCKQTDVLDDDTWDVAKSSGACLMSFAVNCGYTILEFCLPFIHSNIESQDWRLREAATLAFGCIMQGPQPEALQQHIMRLLPIIYKYLGDSSEIVRDTAVWTIGRIIAEAPSSLNIQQIDQILNAFLCLLNDQPPIVVKTCWALFNIFKAADNNTLQGLPNLDDYFDAFIRALFNLTSLDLDDINMIISVYEVMNTLISLSSPQKINVLLHLLPVLIDRIKKTFGTNVENKQIVIDIQSQLCVTIQSILQKAKSQAFQYAAPLMDVFLTILKVPQYSESHEDALTAIGTIAVKVLGKQFNMYLNTFIPILLESLKNVKQAATLFASVGVITELCQAIESDIAPWCDQIMILVLQLLSNTDVNRNVKPCLISCLGDIAIAIGGLYKKYLAYTMPMLVNAAGATKLEGNEEDIDEEDIDFINEMKEAICQSITSILRGLDTTKEASEITQYIPFCLQFISTFAEDKYCDSDAFLAALHLLGDLYDVIPNSLPSRSQLPFFDIMLSKGLNSDDKETVDASKWVQIIWKT